MILQHRPIERWPAEVKIGLQFSPFSASWSSTLSLLERELNHLGARSPVVLQVAVSEDAIRLDGQIRADARPSHPGVILAFETRKLGNISIPCGQFTHWQANVRAIALGLEALRRVERYGIGLRGEQYTGWKALPSGIALGAAMTIDEAARLLCDATMDEIGEDPRDVRRVASVATSLWREAAKKLHPDKGGDPEEFRRLTEARDLLVKVS